MHCLSVRPQDEVESSIDDDDVFAASTKLAVRIHFTESTLAYSQAWQSESCRI
jgi:hypothetical protein